MWRHIKQIWQVIILASVMLVSFPHEAVLGKTTNCSITFYLVHTTLPNNNRVTKISAHTLGWNFKSLHEVNRKLKLFCCFSPYHKKPRAAAKSCARRCVQRRANSLFFILNTQISMNAQVLRVNMVLAKMVLTGIIVCVI